MSALQKAFAGLALGMALTTGALVAGVTAANAGTGPNPNNTQTTDHQRDHVNNNRDKDYWYNNTYSWYPQTQQWTNLLNRDSALERDNLGLVAKDVALGFQEKDTKDDWYGNNGWFNGQSWFGGNDWWWYDDANRQNFQDRANRNNRNQ